jgi:hypothetical protein
VVFYKQIKTKTKMIDPYENDSLEDSKTQVNERWEQDISEMEPDDWEHHFGGPEDEDIHKSPSNYEDE